MCGVLTLVLICFALNVLNKKDVLVFIIFSIMENFLRFFFASSLKTTCQRIFVAVMSGSENISKEFSLDSKPDASSFGRTTTLGASKWISIDFGLILVPHTHQIIFQ